MRAKRTVLEGGLLSMKVDENECRHAVRSSRRGDPPPSRSHGKRHPCLARSATAADPFQNRRLENQKDIPHRKTQKPNRRYTSKLTPPFVPSLSLSPASLASHQKTKTKTGKIKPVTSSTSGSHGSLHPHPLRTLSPEASAPGVHPLRRD